MSKVNRIQVILASIAILTTAAFAQVLAPRELMARSRASLDLEKVIPKQFGEWTLVPSISPVAPDDPEGYKISAHEAEYYSQEVGRGYTDSHGNIVMLLVAYGPIQNSRLKAHRPEFCYTAAGFHVSPKIPARVRYRDDANPLKLQRLIAQRESRFEPISYWMRVGNDIADGPIENQLVRLKYGLRGVVPDGALMRVSTVGMPQDASFQLQDKFIRDLIAALAPQDRPFFVGGS